MPRLHARLSLRYGWTLSLMVALIAAGSILGAAAVNFMELTEKAELMAHLDGFLAVMAGPEGAGDPGALGGELLALQGERMALRLLLLWVAGLTVIGLPVVLGYAFLHAFAVGFTAALLVYQQGLPGLALGAAALLPQNLLILPALVVTGMGALIYAFSLWDRSPGAGWSRSALFYTGACLVAAVLLAGAVVVEAYLLPHLMPWVSAYAG